jgi:hypothetical protein
LLIDWLFVTVFFSDSEVDVFKKLSQKKIITFYIIMTCAILTVVTGCTANSKKRGIIFRGDWAFEINRTPWVGHPGNTDIPDSEKEQKSSVCTKGKGSTLADSLLGPLAAFKSKCHCKNCTAASVSGTNGNTNITSDHPTIASTFSNPFTTAFPGSVPPGSLSLPPGAVVVPNGVLMPNGTILPHYLFFPQQGPGTQYHQQLSVPQPSQNHLQENIQPPQNPQRATTGNHSQQSLPIQPPTLTLPGHISEQSLSTAPSVSAISPVTSSHGTGNTDQTTSQAAKAYAVTPGNETNRLTSKDDAANSAVANGITQNGFAPQISGMPTVSGISPNVAGYMIASPMFPQSVNPMMVNPVDARVVPGLSMTGLSLSGYPPIGYAPTGYSPGFAQPINAPPIAGPLAGLSEQNIAANNPSQSQETQKSKNNSDTAELPQKNVAQMPYPRFHPVPLHPVYQRRPGIAANYGAFQQPLMPQNPNMRMLPGTVSGMMTQEQRLMLERQRQAILWQQQMQQQQARWRDFSQRTEMPNRKISQEDILEEENDMTNISEPSTSKILLANHQTPILQTVAPNVGTAKYINKTTEKNSR